MAKITFLGAAGTVTGSKYLVEAGGKRLLVDCGLFEGSKELRQRNWDALPVDPATIDWVLSPMLTLTTPAICRDS
jgi:metallo-beta-lactamase family protein